MENGYYLFKNKLFIKKHFVLHLWFCPPLSLPSRKNNFWKSRKNNPMLIRNKQPVNINWTNPFWHLPLYIENIKWLFERNCKNILSEFCKCCLKLMDTCHDNSCLFEIANIEICWVQSIFVFRLTVCLVYKTIWLFSTYIQTT